MAIWITGRATEPVYLWIHDGQVEIRDATQLWGLDPYQCQAVLSESLNHGKVRVASIGVAGEIADPLLGHPC